MTDKVTAAERMRKMLKYTEEARKEFEANPRRFYTPMLKHFEEVIEQCKQCIENLEQIVSKVESEPTPEPQTSVVIDKVEKIQHDPSYLTIEITVKNK